MDNELKNILNKVGELYSHYGIKSVTMDDVARELGISKKTLYKYVSDKNELVEKTISYRAQQRGKIFEDILKKNLNAIEELLEINLALQEMMKEYNSSYDYDLKKYFPGLHKKINSTRLARMFETIGNNLRKGKKEGLYRQDVNVDLISRLHAFKIENIHKTEEIFNMQEVMSENFFNEFFNYHIRGIANEKGIKILEKKLKVIKTKK